MSRWRFRILLTLVLSLGAVAVVLPTHGSNAGSPPTLVSTDAAVVAHPPAATHAHHPHHSTTSEVLETRGLAGWLADTPLGFFSGGGHYMPRTHCLMNAAGQPDWPWIITLIVLTTTVIVGYLRIFHFWRKAYLAEHQQDRNQKMMTLAYIFLFCAICGYGFSLLMYVWPAYRLLAVFLLVLNVLTWRFAFNLSDFKVSLSAKRLERELQQTLQERNAQYQTLIACLPDMIFYKNVAGVYLDCNDQFAELFGRPREAIIGHTDYDMFPVPEADEFRRTDQRSQREGLYCFDEWVPGAGGQPIKLHTSKRAFRAADGTLLGVACVARDITALHEQQVALEEAKAVAEAANQAKSTFLANISHEIRTPLTGVLGFAELLLDQEDADAFTRREWAHTIQSAAQHLNTLLNDVLDISKIEAGRMDVERTPMPLHKLLTDLTSVFRPVALAKELSLELYCPHPLPEIIACDPTRLRQILTNLISNALKFTETGGVRIEVELVGGVDEPPDRPDSPSKNDLPDARRSVDVVAPHTRLRIDVVDTGPGLSTQQQSRLFQRFTQADASVNREHGGTGLGLVIARHFCEALGGGLRMESREGFGTRMIVTVDPGPLDPDHFILINEALATPNAPPQLQAPPTGLLNHHPADPANPPPATGRVLMVDDGPINRKFVGVVLQAAGYTMETAPDGRAGVQRVMDDGPYDLILMDMQMPIMDGYAATRALREAGCDCPILALTASALKGNRERCFTAGCDDYLTKPIDRAVLLAAIRDQLHGRASAKSRLLKTDPDLAWLVHDFVKQLDEQLQTMEDNLAAGELEHLVQSAHLLLGSGGTMGFNQLSDLAEVLENAAERADLTLCQTTLTKLRETQQTIVQQNAGSLNTPPTT